jgi:hypothetical protein
MKRKLLKKKKKYLQAPFVDMNANLRQSTLETQFDIKLHF